MNYLNIENKYIEVAGNQIAYRELSQGKSKLPLVMLVHLAATMDQWDPKTVDLLAETQHVIVVDLPGVGASEGIVGETIPEMANQAIDIIHALGFNKINLLGLSMGGMIAQEIIRTQAFLVNKLILVGTGPRDGVEINRVTVTTFKHMFHSFIDGADMKRYIFYTPDVQGKKVAEEIFARMNSRSNELKDKPMATRSFLKQLHAIKVWNQNGRDDLKFITMPTLIVNGDDDRMIPTANSYDMHTKITNNQLIIYPNAGHGSLFQYPEQFNKDVLNFLNN